MEILLAILIFFASLFWMYIAGKLWTAGKLKSERDFRLKQGEKDNGKNR